jgi:hypothetical protein
MHDDDGERQDEKIFGASSLLFGNVILDIIWGGESLFDNRHPLTTPLQTLDPVTNA